MANRSAKAASAVASLLNTDPNASMDALFAAATKADRALTKLPRRSFNASYVLPLKRTRSKAKARVAAAQKGSAKKTPANTTRRRARRRIRLTESARSAARKLVFERDQLVLSAMHGEGNARIAYDLAADIDAYVDRLAHALKK